MPREADVASWHLRQQGIRLPNLVVWQRLRRDEGLLVVGAPAGCGAVQGCDAVHVNLAGRHSVGVFVGGARVARVAYKGGEITLGLGCFVAAEYPVAAGLGAAGGGGSGQGHLVVGDQPREVSGSSRSFDGSDNGQHSNIVALLPRIIGS